MLYYAVNRRLQAPREAVFAALLRLIGGPEQQPTYARLGDPPPHGPGALVVFDLQGYELHEECIELEPPRLRRYRMVSGAPVAHYEAATELSELDAGTATQLSWQGWSDDPDPEALTDWNRLAHRTILGAVDRLETLLQRQ